MLNLILKIKTMQVNYEDLSEDAKKAIDEIEQPDKFLTWYHSDYNNQFYVGEQLIKKYKKDTKTK